MSLKNFFEDEQLVTRGRIFSLCMMFMLLGSCLGVLFTWLALA